MGRRILIISPTPTHPPTAGNRIRIASLMEVLKSLGHDVWFFHKMKEKGDPVAMRKHWGEHYISSPYSMDRPGKLSRSFSRLRRIFKPELSYIYSVDDWYDESLDDELKNLQREYAFDTVMVEYVFFSRALNCFDKSVLKILDTHGVFTDRHKAFLRRNQRPEWYSTTRDQEAKGLSRADVVIAIQNQDRLFFEEIVPVKTITVGHPVSLEKPCKWRDDRCNLLYLGSSNASNYQSIMFFIKEVLPQLQKKIPRLRLVVAGRISGRIDDHEAIIKLGEIDDVRQAYEAADVVINPVQFGTGLKIKSIEAMGQGKPLITTSVGVEGMEEGAGLAFLVADNVSGFVSEIDRLFSDQNYYNAIAKQAFDFSRHWNQSTINELADILKN